jgi:hypothetical protein
MKSLYEACGQTNVLEIVKRSEQSFFCQDAENKYQDIMEELAPSETKEHTSSFTVGATDVKALTILTTVALTDW